MGAQTPVGIHRPPVRVCAVPTGQETRLTVTDVRPLANRAHFNTRSFAAEHNLGLDPVAATYFNSQKEPGTNRRR